MFVKHKCPCPPQKKSKLPGFFQNQSHFRAGAFVKKIIYIQEIGLYGPVLLTVWELLANISTRK